jgi:putative intracellular protease/amidase
MADKKSVLFIVTSHDQLGDSDKKTGYYLSEMAHPYYKLKDEYNIVVATPKGGVAPLDPGSVEGSPDDESQGFLKDAVAQELMNNTKTLDEVNAKDFVAVVYPGGFGPMYDLPDNERSLALCRDIYENGGVVGAVCHGPVAIANVKLSDGSYLVNGKVVTAFGKSETEVIQMQDIEPFSQIDLLEKNGAKIENGENWGDNVKVDGRVVTGQNPASAASMGEAVKKLLA